MSDPEIPVAPKPTVLPMRDLTVKAVMAGIVDFAGQGPKGKQVDVLLDTPIQHPSVERDEHGGPIPGPVQTHAHYGRLASIKVKKDDRVEVGDVIGEGM